MSAPDSSPDSKPHRSSYLPINKFTLLNNACIPITEAFGGYPYQVGSSLLRSDFRDVDVRTILMDEEFDALFYEKPMLWSLVCLSVSEYLSHAVGLPVDYQIQRASDANALESQTVRNPLGMKARPYAGAPGTHTRTSRSAEREGREEPEDH